MIWLALGNALALAVAFAIFLTRQPSGCRHVLALNQVDYTKDYRTDWTTVHSYCRLCGEPSKKDIEGTIPAVNACIRSGVLYIDPIYTITGRGPHRDSTKILDARASDGLGLHQSVAPMNYNELTGASK